MLRWLTQKAIERVVPQQERINPPTHSLKQFRRFQLQSSHNAVIDCIELDHTSFEPTPLPVKVIITACRENDCFENHLQSFANYSNFFKDSNVKLVAFNFRGIQGSTGRAASENDWVDDAMTVINHYREQHNVHIDNILLSGESLGAAVLTLAAARIYKESNQLECPSLLNVRSFSSLTEVLTEKIMTRLGRPLAACLLSSPLLALSVVTGDIFYGLIPFLSVSALSCLQPQIPKHFVQKSVATVLENTFGQVEAFEAFRSLPSHKTDLIRVKRDPLLPVEVSLDHAMRYHFEHEKNALIDQLQCLSLEDERAHLVAQYQNLKDRHLRGPRVHKLHTCDLGRLHTGHHERRIHDGSEPNPNLLQRKEPILEQDERNAQILGDEVWKQKCSRLLNL